MIVNGKYTKGGTTLEVSQDGVFTVVRTGSAVFKFNEIGALVQDGQGVTVAAPKPEPETHQDPRK